MILCISLLLLIFGDGSIMSVERERERRKYADAPQTTNCSWIETLKRATSNKTESNGQQMLSYMYMM